MYVEKNHNLSNICPKNIKKISVCLEKAALSWTISLEKLYCFHYADIRCQILSFFAQKFETFHPATEKIMADCTAKCSMR